MYKSKNCEYRNKYPATRRTTVKVLKGIFFDPEIPDIYELGLIYDVMYIPEDYDVKILMTLTSPNCPVAESLPLEVKEKVKSIDEIKDVVKSKSPLTLLGHTLMSEEAKIRIGNALTAARMSKSDQIVNRVAQSVLVVFDLEDYHPEPYFRIRSC